MGVRISDHNLVLYVKISMMVHITKPINFIPTQSQKMVEQMEGIEFYTHVKISLFRTLLSFKYA